MAKPTKLLDWFRSGAASAAANAGAWTLRRFSKNASDSFSRLIHGYGRRREGTFGEGVFASMLGGWGAAGIWPGSWSANRIEQTQHYRHWVWKAIRLIMDLSTKEAPMIVDVRHKNDEWSHRQGEKLWKQGKAYRPPDRRFLNWRDFGNSVETSRQKAMQVVRPHESFEYVDEEDPLKKIMDRPNEWDTGAQLDQELIMYLELCGNSYEWPVPYRNAPGIAERWIMPAHWVWPQRTGQTNRLVDYYEIRPWGQTAASVPFRFDADELIPYQYKSPLSKIDGQSPLQAGAETVDAYEQTQLARFFSTVNGANIGDVLQLDASQDPDPVTMERFLEQWRNRYQGVFNFNAPGVLPPGTTLERRTGELELAYHNSSDQLRDYTLGLWGLTKSVVGFMEDANRASFEAALAQCFYTVINPRLSMIDTIRTERLASRYGKGKRIFHRDMTPADRATELAEWNAHAKIAPYTGNEFRTWRGMEPLEEGDEVIDPTKQQGQDPFANMSDDELQQALKGGKDGAGANDGVNDAAGFPSAFKRWSPSPSTNGVH